MLRKLLEMSRYLMVLPVIGSLFLTISVVISGLGLVVVQEWEGQTCGQCGIAYVAPRGSVGNTCWGCRLYLRHRCRHCGAPLTVRPTGRHRDGCTACQRSRHRQLFRTWP